MSTKVLDRPQDETKKEPAKRWRNRYFDPNGLDARTLYQFVPNVFVMGGDGSFMGRVWQSKDMAETMADNFIGWTTEVLKVWGYSPFVWDAAYEVD